MGAAGARADAAHGGVRRSRTAAGGDIVDLANGGRLVGTVLRYEPNVGVTIRLPSGEVRELSAAEVAEVRFADRPVTPPPVLPQPRPTTPPPGALGPPPTAPGTPAVVPTAPRVEPWVIPRVESPQPVPWAGTSRTEVAEERGEFPKGGPIHPVLVTGLGARFGSPGRGVAEVGFGLDLRLDPMSVYRPRAALVTGLIAFDSGGVSIVLPLQFRVFPLGLDFPVVTVRAGLGFEIWLRDRNPNWLQLLGEVVFRLSGDSIEVGLTGAALNVTGTPEAQVSLHLSVVFG